MNRKVAPFIDIVRMEDKEAKLKAFITAVVEQSVGQQLGVQPVLLVARSVDSPVAKAVAALVRDGVITSPVEVMFGVLPHDGCAQSACDTLAALAGSDSGRYIRDVRLFDAHEQLVLGPNASWVGDCMRRDPMKRDAYECFAAECVKTSGWARTSHVRLWAACEPLPESVFRLTPAIGDVAVMPAPTQDGADPIAGSST